MVMFCFAFIYTIDPIADPQTRTFTVTLMFRNERVRASVPESLQDVPIARAGVIGKVFVNLPLVAEGHFVDERMLHEDAEGYYILKILNRRIGTLSSSSDALLRVNKIRVTPGDKRLSFLGLASLRQISFAGNEEMNTNEDLFAGDISPPDGQTNWDGDQLLYDRERWLVRPGDLVGVDQSGGAIQPGIYVPLDAIMERSGSHIIFVVSESPAH